MTRIRGDAVELDYHETLAFFERRARDAAPEDCLAVTVFRDREEAERRHNFEKELVLPLLGLDEHSRILEVGCGAGRWTTTFLAETAPPVAGYAGVDFSPGLVRLARQTHAGLSAEFFIMKADELDTGVLAARGPYSHVIVTALLLYLNDTAVGQLYRSIAQLMVPGGFFYVREPICIESDRLTLVNEYSGALGDRYNAVYRTDVEMRRLIERQGSFVIVDSGELASPLFSPHAETRHRYYLARHNS
jgi:SAM-dependent methyltransferase